MGHILEQLKMPSKCNLFSLAFM